MSRIVDCARSWLDTPYHHMERQKGVGVDCAGLVIGVARELGVVAPDFDVPPYPRAADGLTLLAHCRTYMSRVPKVEMAPGHVLVIEWGDGVPHHMGIVGDYRHGGLSFIHAEGYRQKRVIETRLTFTNSMRFVAAFRIPEAA
jgi:NlpC/P60 family putative phage cell wall peptidase